MSLLTVEQLSHGFGDRTIFEDISFRLNRGEHIGLVGANGEGKSTLLRLFWTYSTSISANIFQHSLKT